MSTVHLVMLGTNALAVEFPDSVGEPLDAILAKLRNAAAAVAWLASQEHEKADAIYAPTIGGALTALEVLTSLSEALQQEADGCAAPSEGGADHG